MGACQNSYTSCGMQVGKKALTSSSSCQCNGRSISGHVQGMWACLAMCMHARLILCILYCLNACMARAGRAGRVRVLVRATYLQHSAPGEDGLTDLSRMSLGPSSRPSSFSGGTGEQVPAALPLVGSSVNACASMPAHQQFRHSSVTSVPHLCVRHAGGMMCYNFLLWRKFRMKHN